MRKFDSAAPDVVESLQKGDSEMATSKAKLEAIAKYKKATDKQYFFALKKHIRPKMIDYLESLDNKQAYIRHLIAMDMKAKGIETDGLDGEQD